MILSYSGNMFVFSCSFENRHIAKHAGFNWSPSLKKWYTSYFFIAKSLEKYADESALKEFERSSIVVTESAPETVWPKGLTPRNYQLEGVRWATTRNRSLLRHDPGTGKTIEAALALNAIPGNTLIIVPPFLKINWMRELNTWCVPKRSITLIETGDAIAYNWNVDILIVPDSLIAKPSINKMLMARRFKWVFIDEAHRFKNGATQRTSALFGNDRINAKNTGLVGLGERVVALTGTPMPSRPIELYPILKALAPETIDFSNKHQYAEKYCGAFFDGFGWNYNGASRQDELHKKLRSNFMHVIKKSEVLTELPPKVYEKIYIPHNVLSKAQNDFEHEILKEYALDDLSTKALGQMTAHRKQLGEAKADFAIGFIKEILENTDEKILVFGWHNSVLTKIERALLDYEPFLITGKTPNAVRINYVDQFQADKNKRIIIGNIQAMGVGLTLTAATRVIFTEFSWVPAENEQAEDRIHRIGQLNSCLIQYLVVEDSIDEWQLDSIMKKQENIKKIVG